MPDRPLAHVLRLAGALTAARDGRTVAAHYGSAAGELAVCVRAVGLVDRSDLAVLGTRGPAALLDGVLARLLGTGIAPGGSARVGEAWWCRASHDEVLVVCRQGAASSLRGHLRSQCRRAADLQVEDRSNAYVPIGLVGRAATEVLTGLGVYGRDGDPRQAAPFGRSRIAGSEVLWLLESDTSALALAASDEAAGVWAAIEDAGRPFGLSYVGRDAVDRFRVRDRASLRRVPVPAP